MLLNCKHKSARFFDYLVSSTFNCIKLPFLVIKATFCTIMCGFFPFCSVSFRWVFLTIFGTAMSRQAKENVCNAQSIPVRLHCPFENCHKSYDSKKHKWTLSFYRHGPPCFKFENNTSGRARLWVTALKFLAEAFSWRHQITWLISWSIERSQVSRRRDRCTTFSLPYPHHLHVVYELTKNLTTYQCFYSL